MEHSSKSEAVRRLGIRHPIIQGPFGGGLSTTRLASTVSNLGGLGSFGAHMLPASDIGALVDELRGLTAAPFAVNLWVSDHDQGGLELDEASFDQGWRIFEPYFQELGVARPSRMEQACFVQPGVSSFG